MIRDIESNSERGVGYIQLTSAKGKNMLIQFYGAVREVTGSMHLLTTDNDRILMDCGLYQGKRKDSAEKNNVMPFSPTLLTNMILSHAHIDHSGRIPLLVRKEFPGRIFCTRATADACGFLLPDSAKIQESDAQYLNYKTVKRAIAEMQKNNGRLKDADAKAMQRRLKENGSHRLNTGAIEEFIHRFNLKFEEPLYSMADAEDALEMFEGVPYRNEVTVGNDLTCTFYEAGHILGSAMSVLKHHENGVKKTICFTGDIGRFDKPIIRDPCMNFKEEDREIDLMIMESTYGDRDHEPVVDLKPKLREILNKTYERGGSVVIPSFSFGRTQELLYIIHELYNEGSVTRVPVWVDSPLASNMTKVFGEHPEVYDAETQETFLARHENPFYFSEVNFTESVEDSINLTRDLTPNIVISASGMCENGRILHHLRYKIHNPKNTILAVGYMAQHTLGRRIVEEGEKFEKGGRVGDPPIMRLLGKEYPLLAHVEKLGGFSGHGDRNEMLRFLKESNLNIKKIALVHGEEEQTLAFQKFLQKEGFNVMVPKYGQTVTV